MKARLLRILASAVLGTALGRGASQVGTSTTTGDGGMTEEERGHSSILVYQVLPSRYGMNPDDLRRADAIEIVIGQGAKPGGGGMLLGQKISERVAAMRNLPQGIDQRSACRHPDWTGPDDLTIDALVKRAHDSRVTEIILALNATVDGQTTAHYITDLLQDANVKITRLAHGVPVGGELDYLDEGTLSAAMRQRTLF